MRPYSLDLRQKIVETYEAGGISQRKLAERFRVAPSFVEKLLRRYRETGSVSPKVRTEQTPTKLNSEQIGILTQLVAQQNDATLAELRERLAAETGVSVGLSTIFRLLKKQNLTLKKKRFTPVRKKVIASN